MSNINLEKAMQSLRVGRKLDAFTGVIIHAGQDDGGNDIDYAAGNTSGYVLEVDNPIGTQEMANAILTSLKLRGVRYQPFEAEKARLDPSAEIGDNVTVDGESSVVLSQSTEHGRLMSSDIAAPYDEEVDHEFQYTPRATREFKRETAYARSRIKQTEEQISLEVVRATNAETMLGSRITLTAEQIESEVARASASEGKLSSRITQTADAITSEVTRATGAEGALSSRITQTSDAITSEVTRATGAEGNLSSRITQNADAITSEVTRATGAEGTLSTRIDQRLDSITLSVSSASGSSTFTIKDGSTTLDTKTLDLSVKAVNISGKLTVGQLADGSVVTSSKTETEYYLSTSASSATGGSWSTTVPTWASGKYIWTRQKTTDTRNDGTTNVTYSPQNGAYDKNLTDALSTASSASSAAATAQSTADGAATAASTAQTSANTANANALSATKRTSVIYRSMSGGSAPSAPSSWVTDVTGGQNTWTLIRPEYSSSYPALYIAQQSETVGGTYSCSTPKVDTTTTVIDGGHIITGTIDAAQIATGAITASKIAAGSITADKLTVGTGGNFYSIYDSFEQVSSSTLYFGKSSNLSASVITSPYARDGNKVMWLQTNTDVSNSYIYVGHSSFSNGQVRLTPNSYIASAYVIRAAGDNSPQITMSVYGTASRSTTSSDFTQLGIATATLPNSLNWPTRIEVLFTITDAQYVGLRFQARTASTTYLVDCCQIEAVSSTIQSAGEWHPAATTTISGDSITTGVLNASLITTGTLNADNVNVTNINGVNIKDQTITSTKYGPGSILGGSGGSIGVDTVTTYNTTGGINSGVNGGLNYIAATESGTSSYPSSFKVGYLNVTSAISMSGAAYTPQTKTISGVTIHYLGY